MIKEEVVQRQILQMTPMPNIILTRMKTQKKRMVSGSCYAPDEE